MMLYVGDFIAKTYSSVPTCFQHAVLKLPEYKLLPMVRRSSNTWKHFAYQLKK